MVLSELFHSNSTSKFPSQNDLNNPADHLVNIVSDYTGRPKLQHENMNRISSINELDAEEFEDILDDNGSDGNFDE